MDLQFTYDSYVVTAAISVAAVFLVSLLSLWRRHRVISRFSTVNRGSLYGTPRLLVHVMLFTLVCATVAALLLKPYVLTRERYTLYEPMDVVINLDVSYSMLAQATPEPCGPSRLQMAQEQIRRFLDYLDDRSIDRTGLILFSRFGYRLVPVLTRDYEVVREVLGDFTHREIAMGGLLSGTNHWDAIIESFKVLEPQGTGKRLIIIITDGEPDGPEEILVKKREQALTLISERGASVDVHVIGIGDPISQYLIPLERDSAGCPVEFMVQLEGGDEGALIKTQMDQSWLRALTGQLKAEYHHAESGDELTLALKQIIDTERIAIGTDVSFGKRDISRELLILLLALLVLVVVVKSP